MKKILFITAMAALFLSAGCNTVDTWGDGLPELEHVYYVGFMKNTWGAALNYEVAQNGTARWREATGAWTTTTESSVASIPFQFHSERVRSYNAITNFWLVNTGLVAGTDYSVTLNGTALTPNGDGVYSFAWPETKKGIQYVKITRLTNTNGSVKVYTLDPSKGNPGNNDVAKTVNNKTVEYEIRAFSVDYGNQTVTFTN